MLLIPLERRAKNSGGKRESIVRTIYNNNKRGLSERGVVPSKNDMIYAVDYVVLQRT